MKRGMAAGALAAGLRVTFHYKVLLLIALFAVTCKEAVTWYFRWGGIDPAAVQSNIRAMVSDLAATPLSLHNPLERYSSVYALLPVTLVLLFLSALLLIGLLGLIREILATGGYEPQRVLGYGWSYFWRIVRYKAPLYLLLGLPLYALIEGLGLWTIDGFLALRSMSLLILMSCAPVFLAGRIWLSLGPKLIVARDRRRVLPVFREVLELVASRAWTVVWFYLVCGAVLLCAFLTPLVLLSAKLPPWVVGSSSVIVLASSTVFAKASSFALCLELLGLRKAPADDPQTSRETPATTERGCVHG